MAQGPTAGVVGWWWGTGVCVSQTRTPTQTQDAHPEVSIEKAQPCLSPLRGSGHLSAHPTRFRPDPLGGTEGTREGG